MKEIYRKFINKMLKNLDELILRLIKYFKNFSKNKTGIDYGGIKQNIKNNEDGGLTITEARRIESELGFTNRTTKTQGQEPRSQSKIIFKKDMAKNRDMEFKEQIIKEIIENRKVSREEAVRILANPW